MIRLGVIIMVAVVITTAFYLKPIVMNENEYKIVVVNTSEHDISRVQITGAGEDFGIIGPIEPGRVRHHIFVPQESGSLEYTIYQDNRELSGIINANLTAGETGEIYVVLGEMYKVRIHDDYDI